MIVCLGRSSQCPAGVRRSARVRSASADCVLGPACNLTVRPPRRPACATRRQVIGGSDCRACSTANQASLGLPAAPAPRSSAAVFALAVVFLWGCSRLHGSLAVHAFPTVLFVRWVYTVVRPFWIPSRGGGALALADGMLLREIQHLDRQWTYRGCIGLSCALALSRVAPSVMAEIPLEASKRATRRRSGHP